MEIELQIDRFEADLSAVAEHGESHPAPGDASRGAPVLPHE